LNVVLIWALIGIAYMEAGKGEEVYELATHVIEEYAELFLFLLVAITYVNTLEERRVFDVLRARLVARGLSYRQLFWLTGILGFFLPALRQLTTALIMGAVVMAVGSHSPRFVALGCISIVVAANAGGAFSPFGDITTLMVWQKGKLAFWDFFALFVPSLVNWLVPAALMHFAVPAIRPEPHEDRVRLKPGALASSCLRRHHRHRRPFRTSHPPALGMMLGLGYLQMWSYYLQRRGHRKNDQDMVLDSFAQVQRVEWDTLLFFFGIIFAVGGLGVIGYLAMASQYLYIGLGPTPANVIIGVLSAVVDNIPLMFAVLTMDPRCRRATGCSSPSPPASAARSCRSARRPASPHGRQGPLHLLKPSQWPGPSPRLCCLDAAHL
jgi:Na+/H+ antiporter NhaD/arsenite permease-like protein